MREYDFHEYWYIYFIYIMASFSAVYMQPVFHDVYRRPDITTEQTPALIYSPSNHDHLQVCRQSDITPDFLSHVLGKYQFVGDGYVKRQKLSIFNRIME